MTTPDGLTAGRDLPAGRDLLAYLRTEFGIHSSFIFDRVDSIAREAVAAHVRETGCEGLREALDAEMEAWLSMEENAGIEIRLLSYSPAMRIWVRHTRRKPGTRQRYIRTDGFGPTLSAALAELRAALAAREEAPK